LNEYFQNESLTNTNINKLEEELLKEELNTFLNSMNEYMQLHNFEQDNFMQMLYNDININYKLIGKRKACLYSCSRHSSQGEQTSYNLNLFEENSNSELLTSPYITPTMLETWNKLC
jgi:hypothetical protein